LAALLQPSLRALKPGGHALFWALPRTSHWTATASNLTMALVIGLACFGFYAARAGQPLFGDFADKVKS
jgi:membrane-bound metal-dependent hydrolase YbcI (DUF457 family)